MSMMKRGRLRRWRITWSTRGPVSTASVDKDGAARPFPLQVDGDYIGDRTRVELGVDPGALTIVA